MSIIPHDLHPEIVPFLEDAGRDPNREELNCAWWRLNNVYWFRNKDGQLDRFRMNPEQYHFWANKHNRNIILKARQIGFSTLIQLQMLDSAISTPHFVGHVISYDLESAMKVFDKIKTAYDHLPAAFKKAVPEVSSTKTELVLGNGSRLSVGTSARGGTLSQLHVSEFGKICAKYPDKATEIVTGSIQAVPVGGCVDIESTAEGEAGYYYDMCVQALSDQRRGVELSPMDYKFFFYPWFDCTDYSLPAQTGALIDQETQNYFIELEAKHGIALTPAQKAWYFLKKTRELKDKMKREYPSYPEEAFAQAVEGAIYATEFAKVDKEQRITSLPIDSRYPVHTAWDIGYGDDTAIVFFQRLPSGRVNVIDCYANASEGIAHYVRILDQRGYWYGSHYMPHDADRGEIGSGKTVRQLAYEAGLQNIVVLDRTPDLMSDIHLVRSRFDVVHFHEPRCESLLKALRAYQREWDDKRGTWKDRPRHDWTSHFADAFRCMCVSLPSDMQQPSIGGASSFDFGAHVQSVKSITSKRFI